MSEEKKAWRDFWDKYELDKRPPHEASAMCYGWQRGFGKGCEMASQNARKDEPADGNVRFAPKSGGTVAGNLVLKEEQCHVFLTGESEKSKQGSHYYTKFAIGVAAIALVISMVALITVVAHLISQGV